MRILAFLICLLLPAVAIAQPNVVLVIADDMHWSHFGANAKTPNFDWMIASGTTFPNGYCPQPICRPSLATLLTGRTPHSTGALNHNYTVSPTIPNTIATLPKSLKDAGYRTRMDGKWWEGTPSGYGFDEYSTDSIANVALVRGGQYNTLRFIEQSVAANEPFFLWWAPLVPHLPHDPHQGFLDLHPQPGIAIPSWFSGNTTAYKTAEQKLQAMNTWLDEDFGALRDRINFLGELNNTIFVFVSDNGWVTGAPGKSSPYDHGVRSQVVFRGPNIAAQSLSRLVRFEDIPSTILGQCGVTIPAGFQGTNLSGDIGGNPTPQQYVYGFCYGHDAGAGLEFAVYARRDDGYKYICWLQNTDQSYITKKWIFSEAGPTPIRLIGQEELYNVAVDPGEISPITNTAIRDEMRAATNSWWTGLGSAPLPVSDAVIYDDTNAAFQVVSGTWGTGIVGYGGAGRWHTAGGGESVAKWSIPTEQGKKYKVAVTWPAATNRATNTPYNVINGASETGFVINQELAPSDFTEGGVGWKDLGQYTASGATITIEVNNNANEYVMADAVRIEEVP